MSAQKNQTAGSASLSHGLLCFFIICLGGIRDVVQEVLKIHANLLKLTLPVFLVCIFSSDCMGRMEIGITQNEKSIYQPIKILPPKSRYIILNRNALLANRLPMLIVELPKIHSVLLSSLGSQATHSSLERSKSISSITVAAKPIPEPKKKSATKETSEKAGKNALIKYIHTGYWLIPLLTAIIGFVVGWIIGRFRIQIGWWIERKNSLHNV